MTISLKRPSLSKPQKGEKISVHNISYARARGKNKAHSLMLDLFSESGLSKTQLANMLGKKPEQITRWLSGPGNMTMETFSDLVFAVSGCFIDIKISDDLSKGKSNRRSPGWLFFQVESSKKITQTNALTPNINAISVPVVSANSMHDNEVRISYGSSITSSNQNYARP